MEEIVTNKTSFYNLLKSGMRFRLFLLKKLPAAYMAGLQLEELNHEGCTVSVRYKWLTQNPFRSTYFACLGMAAEMSTGILAMGATYKQVPPISMLITGMESKFHKKAVSKTRFSCADAKPVEEAVRAAISSGSPQVVKMYSKGINEKGELVAEFWFTWSLKARA